MDPSQVVDFLGAMLPLVVAHFVVPPLSYFIGDHLPLITKLTDEYYTKNYTPFRVRSLMLDPKLDTVGEKLLHWITYMFVHANYNHLLNNIQGMISAGVPVYAHVGASGLYLVFFVGGLVTPMPTSIRKIQEKRDYNFFGHWFSKLTGINAKYCGSSGAVFALFGAGNTLRIMDFSWRVHAALMEIYDAHCTGEYFSRSWNYLGTRTGATDSEMRRQCEGDGRSHTINPNATVERANSHTTANQGSGSSSFVRDVKILQSHLRPETWLPAVLNVAHTVSVIRQEWYQAQGKRGKAESDNLIDNAGHLQGFVAGVGLGVAFGLLLPFYRSYHRHKLLCT